MRSLAVGSAQRSATQGVAGQDASRPSHRRAGAPSAASGGGRRGRVLIAGEPFDDVGGDRGPAGELGLERRDRGDRLERGADPQAVGLVVLRDRWVEHVGKKRLEVG